MVKGRGGPLAVLVLAMEPDESACEISEFVGAIDPLESDGRF